MNLDEFVFTNDVFPESRLVTEADEPRYTLRFLPCPLPISPVIDATVIGGASSTITIPPRRAVKALRCRLNIVF